MTQKNEPCKFLGNFSALGSGRPTAAAQMNFRLGLSTANLTRSSRTSVANRQCVSRDFLTQGGPVDIENSVWLIIQRLMSLEQICIFPYYLSSQARIRRTRLSICWMIRAIFKAIFKSRASLVAENLALRQQLAVLQRKVKRPRLRNSDRLFWVWLSRLWHGWRSTLLIVQPETVIKWHRQGFKLYWRFKSRKRPGRPRISHEIRKLIRQMSQDNASWGSSQNQIGISFAGLSSRRINSCQVYAPPKEASVTEVEGISFESC